MKKTSFEVFFTPALTGCPPAENRIESWYIPMCHSQLLLYARMIRDHIATSLRVEMSDLELSPFHDKGGPVKAYETFGTDLNKLLEELNEVLAA